ncbi:unnamed protein product [Chrysodeixis includens]|uniref:SCP domain-containing protein n=1 Tax=Chrysodeixis includens TaxID=689277 RepID=A0A9P0C3L6_CHRIL|nr:unnamed protein product [Chrysodeixis includens]
MRRANKKCVKLVVTSTMQCIAFVLGCALAGAGGLAVNYCGARMCGNTDSHTFCQYPEGPSPDCVGYISAHLTIDEKSRVIARLNRRRNEAAAGNMRGLPSAGNMLKLRWVEELAREAQRWADQCRPPRTLEEHDACRDLYSIAVGQCVASVVGEAPGLRVESMVDIWYMQSMLYKGNVTFYMPSNRNGTFYGDFAQIMWARSYMVGCGRSRFMTPWQGRLRSVERLVCNIAPLGPPANRPLWAPAAPAASCPPRSLRDPAMNALCDYQRNSNEIVRIGASMTLEEHILLNAVLEIENDASRNYQGSLDEMYLTRLAIATMENTVTTEVFYNSMQRRDVVEALELSEARDEKRLTSIMTTVKTASGANNTLLSANETTAKGIKATKKKISLVGRPKSYNIEELTDFDDKTENNTPIEEIPKREKEFYEEYVYNQFEMPDENVTTITTVDLTNATTVETTVETTMANINVVFDQEILKDMLAKLNQNDTIFGLDNGFENNRISPSYISTNGSTTMVNSGLANETTIGLVTTDNIDDYLSDPETVRELQEALERIENEMSPAKNSGKVRRELREPEEEDQASKSAEELVADVERNRSIDRSPMYNMVLKYMPYLKQYEGGLLSPSDDSGAIRANVSPLFMLVVTFCL